LVELTRIYFHANHFTSEQGTTFTPRFTLTSLHLPIDELDETVRTDLVQRRNAPFNIELLVPANDAARRHIDAQVDAYEGLSHQRRPTDASPAVLFVSAAPVRWLGQLLVSEGATTSGIRYDKNLTHLERIASMFSVVVLLGAPRWPCPACPGRRPRGPRRHERQHHRRRDRLLTCDGSDARREENGGGPIDRLGT